MQTYWKLFGDEERVQKTVFAEVLAVGPGRFIETTGTVRPVEVKPGQVVVLHGTAGHEVKANDDPNHLIVREDEIQAIVEEP
jgi:co-chaperonin GroES (HSP10)